MKTRLCIIAIPLLTGAFATGTVAVAQVEPERAQHYFAEVTALCEREAGRLWGVSLCSPMVIRPRRDPNACDKSA
jgi:hypothetical protein